MGTKVIDILILVKSIISLIWYFKIYFLLQFLILYFYCEYEKQKNVIFIKNRHLFLLKIKNDCFKNRDYLN
jgi:hypothetical protein